MGWWITGEKRYCPFNRFGQRLNKIKRNCLLEI